MKVLFTLFAIPAVLAHYTLDFPPTTGFDENQEPNAPCGGFNPSASNVTAWPLTAGQISIDSHHPVMTLLYRAQLMGADSWVNLTDGFVTVSGLGELCINAVGSLPSSWSGKIGVVQVIGEPADGILYQCAGVNFTEGAPGSSLCKNGTGVTLTSSPTGINISSDNVQFTGASGSASSTSSPSATSTAKSGAGVLQVSIVSVISALCLAAALW